MSQMNASKHTDELEIQVVVPIANCLEQPPPKLAAKINEHQDTSVPNLINSEFLEGTTAKEKLSIGENL